jgi:XTP/dITP diphosphohydrolase
MGELHEEVERGDKEAMKKELGDVFFSLVNYAEHLGINAEEALECTNKKFISRFMTMERLIDEAGENLSQMNVNDMEVFWQRAKEYEK